MKKTYLIKTKNNMAGRKHIDKYLKIWTNIDKTDKYNVIRMKGGKQNSIVHLAMS